MIDMAAIRDDGGHKIEPPSWRDADDFIAAARRQASRLRLDRSAGQHQRLVVMCEAAGMAPQLARVAGEYGVPVLSSGGFDSTTERFRFAQEVASEDRPVEVLQIGDHDPSGAHMFLALSEDVEAFVWELGGKVRFSRLAVTPDQIAARDLPTAPAKATDVRAFNGETCQAEAIPPDVLASILEAAINDRIDQKALETVLRNEPLVQAELVDRLGGAS